MTRRRAGTRRARWLLAASAAAGGGTYGWLHVQWAAYAAVITLWAIYGAYRLARRRRPRRHRAPRPPRSVAATNDHRPHAVYRAYSNRTGQLLYVGICVLHDERDVQDRIDEHVQKQPWWSADVRMPVDDYALYYGRATAFAAEAYAIHAYQPPWNLTHVGHTLAQCETYAAARAMETP